MKSKYVTALIITFILISFTFFTYKTTKGQELLSNPLEVKPQSVARGIFSWVSALLYYLLPIFVIFLVYFLLYYFIISFGFKVLKIEGITKKKILIYIFLILFIGIFLLPFINKLFLRLSSVMFLYLTDILLSFVINLVLVRYYFFLSGKKLWQFVLYITIINLIFSGIITLLSSPNRF